MDNPVSDPEDTIVAALSKEVEQLKAKLEKQKAASLGLIEKAEQKAVEAQQQLGSIQNENKVLANTVILLEGKLGDIQINAMNPKQLLELEDLCIEAAQNIVLQGGPKGKREAQLFTRLQNVRG